MQTISRMLRPAKLPVQVRQTNARPRPWLAIILVGAVLCPLLAKPGRSEAASTVLAPASAGATVTFSLDFPKSDPEHYQITVSADGHARYECSALVLAGSDDHETYQAEFTVSEPTRTRIFELAVQAHYFNAKVDSGNRKLAFMGTKKLVYTDGQQNNTAEFNFSPLPPVQQITELFQNLASTMEYGRRLAHQHRYQKLALDDELKRMEDQARRGELAELGAVKPTLQAIYDDPSVLNVVRARARRVMDMSAAPRSAP